MEKRLVTRQSPQIIILNSNKKMNILKRIFKFFNIDNENDVKSKQQYTSEHEDDFSDLVETLRTRLDTVAEKYQNAVIFKVKNCGCCVEINLKTTRKFKSKVEVTFSTAPLRNIYDVIEIVNEINKFLSKACDNVFVSGGGRLKVRMLNAQNGTVFVGNGWGGKNVSVTISESNSNSNVSANGSEDNNKTTQINVGDTVNVALNNSFSAMNNAFSAMNNAFSEMNSSFAKMNENFANMDKGFEKMDEAFSYMDKGFSEMDKHFDKD